MSRKNKNTKKNILIEDFPVHHQRYNYDCGICSLWCVLKYLGSTLSYWDAYHLLGPNQKDGVEGERIEEALTGLGIRFISEKSNIEKIKTYANNNLPSIVSIQHRKEYNKDWKQTTKYGHYAVVLKVDDKKVFLMDPKYGKIRSLGIKEFKDRWHDGDDSQLYRNCAITCLSKI